METEEESEFEPRQVGSGVLHILPATLLMYLSTDRRSCA